MYSHVTSGESQTDIRHDNLYKGRSAHKPSQAYPCALAGEASGDTGYRNSPCAATFGGSREHAFQADES